MHISVLTAGSTPKIECCKTCCKQVHCPLCLKFKPAELSKLQSHLEAHKKGGISFKDKIICRCGLNCRDQGHYHCPVCSKTVLRRTDMTKHLEVCQRAMTAASPEKTSPPTHKNGCCWRYGPVPVACGLRMRHLPFANQIREIWSRDSR